MNDRKMAIEVIATKIFEIRGKKVMLDKDLAKLYNVPLKVFNQAVKRNILRFPEDFMFKLTWEEAQSLRSQFVTLDKGSIPSPGRGEYPKYTPYVFTQEGVAMLSGVLKSRRAVGVNIQIMRAFIRLKELLLTHKDLADKIEALEKKYANHDDKIRLIFEAIKQLLAPPKVEERKITGFKVEK